MAGCSGILGGGGGGGSSGPKGAIKDYADAVNDNDADAYNDLAHPDGSMSAGSVTDAQLEGLSVSINSMEVVEESSDRAVVRVEAESTLSGDGEEMSSTSTTRFELRKHEGEWKIYSSETVSGGGN